MKRGRRARATTTSDATTDADADARRGTTHAARGGSDRTNACTNADNDEDNKKNHAEI